MIRTQWVCDGCQKTEVADAGPKTAAIPPTWLFIGVTVEAGRHEPDTQPLGKSGHVCSKACAAKVCRAIASSLEKQ